MNPILKNSLIVIAGILIGSIVNMGLITLGPYLIPAPEGADVSSREGLKASMHLFQPKHFVFPWLAHALGTFSGAFAAAKIAERNQMKLALGIGIFFLLGGTANVFMLPSPAWFNTLDLIFAYLPMAYLAGKLASKNVQSSAN